MPVILFDDVDALRLVLTSGALPSPLVRGRARAGFDGNGRLWLQPAGELARGTIAALTRLGAKVQGTSGCELNESLSSWIELLPLVPDPVDPGEHATRVLFTLDDAKELPALVSEARRLGAGKITVKVESDIGADVSPKASPTRRAFALIESTPYHVLLRAADPNGSMHAFAEHSRHVWIEVGWRHPAVELVTPPDGYEVLIRSPRKWESMPHLNEQTVHESFIVPSSNVLAEQSAQVTWPIVLRLARTRAVEGPEFWVVSSNPLIQLRQLAENSDDRLIGRLSVAIADAGDDTIAVIRATPNRGELPTLVLDALACSQYLRLPNLFLPLGWRLSPPLRRDLVRQVFAADPDTVVWLTPNEAKRFTVHSLPQAAFHPFEQMVSYVQSVAPQAVRVDDAKRGIVPEPYIVRRQRAPLTSKQTPIAVRPTESLQTPLIPRQPGLIQRIVQWITPRTPESEPRGRARTQQGRAPERNARLADERCRVLQERILAIAPSSDSSEQPAPWPELAQEYEALSRPGDAAVCWLNALWELQDTSFSWNWLQCEMMAIPEAGHEIDLRGWLAESPTPAIIRSLAAYASWAAEQNPPPDVFVESLQQIQSLLNEHDDWLPVRAAWLAQIAFSRVAGGDPVGLARTRDRLLRRLLESGLSADLDLPPAIRFSGVGERIEAVRQWLAQARAPIHRWLGLQPGESEMHSGGESLSTAHDPRLRAFGLGTATGPTRTYADLILSWGLARIGERASSQELLAQSRGILSRLDEAHGILLEAFAYRIAQATEGRASGPLPADLLTRLSDLEQHERVDPQAREQMLRFKVERLRQYSRILEPAERVHAFREGWLDPHAISEQDRELNGLRTIVDRYELAQRLLSIVASTEINGERMPFVLATALDLAPRLGESIASVVLQRLLGVLDSWTFAGSPERVEAEVSALERGLFVAAHFDQSSSAQKLISSLGRLFDTWRGGEPGENRPIEDALLALIGQSIRGLRRLGLRVEADQFLNRLGEWVAPRQDFAAERRRRPQLWPMTVRRLLALAGGWFYVGRDQPAIEVLDEARRLLFASNPPQQERRMHLELACAYTGALGLAPARMAINGVQELFEQLHGAGDNFITNTHYSLAKLRVVEAAVSAVVTDDFVLGPAVRRWLDDDEYRVRRLIHSDSRRLINVTQ